MRAFLFFLLLPLQMLAQDLTGVWAGSLQSTGSTMPYELVISGTNDQLSGYAMTVFIFNGVENMGVKTIRLKSKGGAILLEDDELVYHNYSTPPKRHKLIGTLTLSGRGEKMTLSGTFATRSLDFRSKDSYSGTIQLQKQPNAAGTKLMAKLEELRLTETLTFLPPGAIKKEPIPVTTVAAAKPPAPKAENEATQNPPPTTTSPLPQTTEGTPVTAATSNPEPTGPELDLKQRHTGIIADRNLPKHGVADASLQRRAQGSAPSPALSAARAVILPAAHLMSRRSEVVSSVAVVNDSLVLSLYDNGEIDGDTVSVVLNNVVIIARKGLTATALRTTVYLTPEMGDSVQLTLYAENLGRIAPNTGLLVVQDGSSRHEIRFAGDYQKNAAIILRRKR